MQFSKLTIPLALAAFSGSSVCAYENILGRDAAAAASAEEYWSSDDSLFDIYARDAFSFEGFMDDYFEVDHQLASRQIDALEERDAQLLHARGILDWIRSCRKGKPPKPVRQCTLCHHLYYDGEALCRRHRGPVTTVVVNEHELPNIRVTQAQAAC